MRKIFILIIVLISTNSFAQGNFTVEWESPAGWRTHNSWADPQGIFKLNATSNIYHLGLEEISNPDNLRFYNGASHSLDYNWSSSEYVFGITGLYYGEDYSTGKFDVNGDGINELINSGGGVVNPVNGEIFYSTPDHIYHIIDIDGDGYLEIIQTAGFPSYIIKIVSTPAQTVSAENNTEIVKNYDLKQNYPNPFNPNTMIEYSLNKNSDVKIVIYDILGKEVNTLVDQNQIPGIYKLNVEGNDLSSGTYFYKLIINGAAEAKKMILVK